MIFADKVIRLRKKNGWSQEELADKMGVSRQSVSKWEGAQAIPDLTKILQLSQLFGVTTDYLLKDELEDEEFTGNSEESTVRRVTLAEANTYLDWRQHAAIRVALATLLCILAAIPLILLGTATELPSFPLTEKLACGIGLVALLVIVACAVMIFVGCGFRNTPYEFLDKEPFELEYGVRGMVKERMESFRKTYVRSNLIGTCLCVLSPVSLFIGAFTGKDFFTVVMLTVTMLVAGIGVVFFVTAGVPHAAMQRLLGEGDFSRAKKKANPILETVSLVFWLTATAIYLGFSFATNDWHVSWIVWPIAGVLYAAVMSICNLIIKKNDK